MKRLFSFLLSLSIISTLTIGNVSAQELSSWPWSYTQDGVITNYKGTEPYLTLPTELAGTAITKLGEGAFFYCDSILSVTVPEGYTSVGDWAFADCRNLQTVYLPSSLNKIGAMCFWQSPSLQSVGINKATNSIKGAPWGAGYNFNYHYSFWVPINWYTQAPPQLIAKSTTATLMADGTMQSLCSYNIEGNNYYKLRDIATLLSSTSKCFSVDWNHESREIILTSGEQYEPQEGDLSPGDGLTKLYASTQAKLMINGGETALTAYTIEGNNYYKLRDLAEIFNFGVTWVAQEKAIYLSSTESYVPA